MESLKIICLRPRDFVILVRKDPADREYHGEEIAPVFNPTWEFAISDEYRVLLTPGKKHCNPLRCFGTNLGISSPLLLTSDWNTQRGVVVQFWRW